MMNLTEINGRSVLFGACVLLGLVISWFEGATYLDLARTALLACILFLCFLLGEAALNRYRHTLPRFRRRR